MTLQLLFCPDVVEAPEINGDAAMQEAQDEVVVDRVEEWVSNRGPGDAAPPPVPVS